MGDEREISRQRRHQLARRAKGLCSKEGCKNPSPRYRCEECAEKHKLAMRAFRATGG